MSDQADLREGRIQAVLQEVQFIRQEILDNVGRLHRTEASALGLFGALLALALHEDEPLVLLAGPLLTVVFTFLWLSCQTHLDTSSIYLRDEIEKRKWPELIGLRKVEGEKAPHRRYWVGWQHYFDQGIPSVREGWIAPACVWLLGLATLIGGAVTPGATSNPLVILVIIASVPLLGLSFWCLTHRITTGSYRRFREARAHKARLAGPADGLGADAPKAGAPSREEESPGPS